MHIFLSKTFSVAKFSFYPNHQAILMINICKQNYLLIYLPVKQKVESEHTFYIGKESQKIKKNIVKNMSLTNDIIIRAEELPQLMLNNFTNFAASH